MVQPTLAKKRNVGLLPNEWGNLVKGISQRLAGEGFVGVFPWGTLPGFLGTLRESSLPFVRGGEVG